MEKKRIALIAYDPVSYFQDVAKSLENTGFEVYWVHNRKSATITHKKILFTDPAKILETTEGFQPDIRDVELCKQELAEYEFESGPTINDIILMDRILRKKNYFSALCYLNHLQGVLHEFFIKNEIKIVTSGRDTALQMMSMLVCRKLNIPWVVPTRVRIPKDMYMFASGHETASIIKIRKPEKKDIIWAKGFLENYRKEKTKPALKIAATRFSDVIRIAPTHAKVFISLVKASLADKGNDYSRYKITDIIWMYIRRRLNLITFKVCSPFRAVGKHPFCLYALHTQPESSIDVAGSFFSDQVALITFISRSLPVSHELYVKIHPSDVDGKSIFYYRKIAKIPGVRLINYDVDSSSLMQNAEMIFSLTGTIGFEAGLIGKTVITFAKNYYNDMPTVHYCDTITRLPHMIRTLLKGIPIARLDERLISFLANIKAQSFIGEFNRMYLPGQNRLTTRDLDAIQNAYNVVYTQVNANELTR